MTSFDIIFHSGNARTLIHEAFRSMRKEMFEEVEEKLRQANEEILHAHQSQTQLLKEYARDKNRNGNYHGPCTRSSDDDDDIIGSCTGNELFVSKINRKEGSLCRIQ